MKTLILPGMGADSAMYPKKYYTYLSGVRFADWPEYHGEQTIRALALRVIDEHDITADMIVGGSSLGGMVAIEIAKIIDVKKVILIGSATGAEMINPGLRMLSMFSNIAPFTLFQILAGKLNNSGSNVVLSMFHRADCRFVRAMCSAIFTWDGIAEYRGEICHIHGRRDLVIYPPEGNAEIITDGGHLISMTHGALVADFIDRSIAV